MNIAKAEDQRVIPLVFCYVIFRIMLEDTLLWLGLIGLIGGIMVGFSLLENDSNPFLRNLMFSIGIAVVMFVYILNLGEKKPLSAVFLGVVAFIGSAAFMLVANFAGGNIRAALVAGSLAGVTSFSISNILPHGSFGYTIHDIPTLINFCVTATVGGLAYYLLRNWGKDDIKWD